MLKDGADSVGALGALNRVYLNIGLFSEEWLLHFNPVVGGRPISPIRSPRRRGTRPIGGPPRPARRSPPSSSSRPPGRTAWPTPPAGPAYLAADAALLDRGKTVFADTCARCHSSKAPAPAPGLDPGGCAGAGYLTCFKRYWAWTKTDDYKRQMRAIVAAPDFLDGNYLSTDVRVPVTLLRTNACSPLATNALGGNIWDNFSSRSYKNLPSVGVITVRDPFTGDPRPYTMPAGGRGYTRPPSLISVWSTAPFLLNNSVGPFSEDPSVDGRMRVFNASIEQMLWPEKREQDAVLGSKIHGKIDRTEVRSWVTIPAGYLPDALRPRQPWLHRWFPWLVDAGGDITLGPIPAGVPVNLLANTRLLAEGADPARHAANLLALVVRMKHDLLTMPRDASDQALRAKFADLGAPLLGLSKCPDFVVNRGHLFGTAAFNMQENLSGDERAFGTEPELTDTDRRAVIAFLKTF